MLNKNNFIISIVLFAFSCAQIALGKGAQESRIRAKSAGEVNFVQDIITDGLIVSNANGSPVEEIERKINTYGKQDETAVKELISKLIDFICDKDKTYRLSWICD